MRKRIKYTDEPMDGVQVIPDFLPPPKQLVLNEGNANVTLSISHHSIGFVKRDANKWKSVE